MVISPVGGSSFIPPSDDMRIDVKHEAAIQMDTISQDVDKYKKDFVAQDPTAAYQDGMKLHNDAEKFKQFMNKNINCFKDPTNLSTSVNTYSSMIDKLLASPYSSDPGSDFQSSAQQLHPDIPNSVAWELNNQINE